MNKINVKHLETKLINSTKLKKSQNNKVNNKNFEEVLKNIQQPNNGIKFSKHALNRINNRDITVTTEEVAKLESAIEKADKKGISDALIYMDDKAFIVSIDNKTIVTTISKGQLKDNIFTNIDGAVII